MSNRSETPVVVQHAIYVNNIKSELENQILKLEYQKQSLETESRNYANEIETLNRKNQNASIEYERLSATVAENETRIRSLKESLPGKQDKIKTVYDEVESRLRLLGEEIRNTNNQLRDFTRQGEKKAQLANTLRDAFIARAKNKPVVDSAVVSNASFSKEATDTRNKMKLSRDEVEKKIRQLQYLRQERAQCEKSMVVLKERSQDLGTNYISAANGKSMLNHAHNCSTLSQKPCLDQDLEALSVVFGIPIEVLQEIAVSEQSDSNLRNLYLNDPSNVAEFRNQSTTGLVKIANAISFFRDVLRCSAKLWDDVRRVHDISSSPTMPLTREEQTQLGLKCMVCLYGELNFPGDKDKIESIEEDETLDLFDDMSTTSFSLVKKQKMN